MSQRQTPPAIPDVRLERFRLGELPCDEQGALSRQVAADPALRARVEALEASDRDVAAAYPADAMAAAIRNRARQEPAAAVPRRSPWRRVLVPASAVAACACVVLAVALWHPWPSQSDETSKGGGTPSLVLHRRVDQTSEALARGAVARQGDQVRIGYRASGGRFGAIVSIDGRGTLTQHLPRHGDRAVALQASGTVFLDFAYELDDAPRWEVFYFVTSDSPFDIETVRRAARAAAAGSGAPGSLALPAGFAQAAFPLVKDTK